MRVGDLESKRPRVLLVEDSPTQAHAVMGRLESAWGGGRPAHAGSLADAIGALASGDAACDCVLLDLGLPDADGLEALKRIRATAPETAIVVLSAQDDDTMALRAVREGAQDYLVKGTVAGSQIARAITYAIERQRQEAELIRQAYLDGLTGLPNRRRFAEQLDHAVRRLQRRPDSLSLLYADLDGFKRINDRLGHGAGDDLLIEVGRRLRRSVRRGDLVARLGGDEFAVLCEGAGPGDATEIASRARAEIAGPALAGGEPVVVTASIGIATAHACDTDPDALLLAADSAMYREKAAAGRARERTAS